MRIRYWIREQSQCGGSMQRMAFGPNANHTTSSLRWIIHQLPLHRQRHPIKIMQIWILSRWIANKSFSDLANEPHTRSWFSTHRVNEPNPIRSKLRPKNVHLFRSQQFCEPATSNRHRADAAMQRYTRSAHNERSLSAYLHNRLFLALCCLFVCSHVAVQINRK